MFSHSALTDCNVEFEGIFPTPVSDVTVLRSLSHIDVLPRLSQRSAETPGFMPTPAAATPGTAALGPARLGPIDEALRDLRLWPDDWPHRLGFFASRSALSDCHKTIKPNRLVSALLEPLRGAANDGTNGSSRWVRRELPVRPHNEFLGIGVRFTDGTRAVIPEGGKIRRRCSALGPNGPFYALRNSMLA
jgi:hypothetical protein